MDSDPREVEQNLQRVATVAPADTLSPADRYQELFVAVQSQSIFPDSKTFVDCAPLGDPEAILDAYRAQRRTPGFDLAAFVNEHFVQEHPPQSKYLADPDRTLVEHIDYLWGVLTREPREHPTRSSLLPLPNPYVVPGGRFGEMYYWDSYFTMLGIAVSGRIDLVRCMADNFAYLIDTFGHIPNGTRSYYLSRSQPPLFAMMTDLCEQCGASGARRYLPRLRKEYAYWMDGADELRNGEAHRHCVRMPDGSLLNRYWDDRDTPREESFREDVATAASQTARPVHEVYRELRAGAASGWDFSSRWCAEDESLGSIRTTAIIPVDLNSFLYKLESQIARLGAEAGDEDCHDDFGGRAAARKAAVDRWLWDAEAAAYFDYDFLLDHPRPILSAAVASPLAVGLADQRQAHGVAEIVRAHMLAPGGLMTTLSFTGEQWDRPNGWAPLQWLAIEGFRRYGQTELAEDIAHRWLATTRSLFEREGKLVEKYELRPSEINGAGGGGGEYPLQDGFGWTNGVARALLRDYPDRPVSEAHRRSRG
jgi:alpha,alpha-trehalase